MWMRRWMVWVFSLVLFLPAVREAEALPRMSLMSGAPCSTCHVNKQGGEMRSEIGWGASAYMGMWEYDDLGIDWLADIYSNEVIEGRVSVGLDARLQMARLGRPSVGLTEEGSMEVVAPGRRIFPMQLQPHVAVQVLDFLKVYGSYAVGPGTFRGDLCDTPYAGQSCYTAQAIIEPSPRSPSFRLGMMQPSIGIRHDDHTMLIRQDVSRERGVLIPANYAELGAEVTYQPRYWLKLDAGGFRAAGLAEVVADESIVSVNDPAYLGRISLMPRFELGEGSYFGLMGASGYGAGRFHMQNLFVGLGLLDRASILLEAARFTEGSEAEKLGLNLSWVLSIQAWEWLVFEGRVERGWTRVGEIEEFETRSAVLGIQYYPIPYVKLRPEYRLIQTNEYAMGQYTAQLHLFF